MKHDYSSLIDDYKKNGFVIVDNFLPEDIANRLELLYSGKDNDWTFTDQTRPDFFKKSHSQSSYTNSVYFPGEDETYSAKFWNSIPLTDNTENIHDEYFKPILERIGEAELNDYYIRCYKLDDGCHYRTHIDNWVGEIGCIYYVNKKWIWDWGGILHVGVDNEVDKVVPIFPKFNRAIFVNHGGFKFPHYISHVASYALNPRFSMITFAK